MNGADASRWRERGGMLDRLLRECLTATNASERDGVRGASRRSLAIACGALCAIYGVFMGLYAVSLHGWSGVGQLLATTIKVPLLFALTMAVTFPSFYVFSAILRSSLDVGDAVRLQLSALTLAAALLASFGPVTGLFTLSTDSYGFMVLLNVALFGVCGFVGLRFLRRGLASGFERSTEDGSEPAPAPPLLRIWLVLFAVVGAQISWILRPFIGNPDEPFTMFRARQSSFFESVLQTFLDLFR